MNAITNHLRVCLVLMCVLLAILPGTTSIPAALAAGQPAGGTPTPVQSPGTQPDECEENDTLVQPCAVPTEVELADLNFVDDNVDVYSVLLKAGRTYAMRARSAAGVDPALTVFLAGETGSPLAHNDDYGAGSGDAEVRLDVRAEAWYLVQVENRAPGSMRGRAYQLGIHSQQPGPQTPFPVPDAAGDGYENNYDLAHAARLGWGIPYDLNLVCPETRPDACPAGDHDFFLVPVKQGVPLVALTYDLGPGADTTLALYVPAAGQRDPATGLEGWRLAQGNDDAAANGATLRSQVMLTPTWNGEALLVVAASDRHNPPAVPPSSGAPARYRLIVGSPALPAVQQVLAEQASATTPDAAPTALTAPPQPTGSIPATPVLPAATVIATAVIGQSADGEEIIREQCVTGRAVVVGAEGARFSAAAMPGNENRILMLFPQGSSVELLGSCYLGWVKVLPDASVTPGWMFAPDLRLEQAPEPAAEGTAQIVDAAGPESATHMPSKQPTIVALPLRKSEAPSALAHIALATTVEVFNQHDEARVGLRVQLVDVAGRVLHEAVTDQNGRLVITADLPASATAWVQIPAAGVTVAVDRDMPHLVFVIPET